MTSLDFAVRKNQNQKISMVTCYDATFAKLVNQSNIDCILIGDSLAMVMHGEKTTLPASIELMELHTKAVRNGAPDKFIVSDMPFLSTRKGKKYATDCAQKLLCSGANAVKIEGVFGQENIISHLVQSGIPVMSHLGLTPQFFNALGGHKRQGKTEDSAKKIIEEAKIAQDIGCFSVVLECIPKDLAKKITESVNIPTIGIGAGLDCDGQVLVLQDMLGLTDFKPKFVHHFLNGKDLVLEALNKYGAEVANKSFPYTENI